MEVGVSPILDSRVTWRGVVVFAPALSSKSALTGNPIQRGCAKIVERPRLRGASEADTEGRPRERVEPCGEITVTFCMREHLEHGGGVLHGVGARKRIQQLDCHR